jgi:hypothetical protein
MKEIDKKYSDSILISNPRIIPVHMTLDEINDVYMILHQCISEGYIGVGDPAYNIFMALDNYLEQI